MPSVSEILHNIDAVDHCALKNSLTLEIMPADRDNVFINLVIWQSKERLLSNVTPRYFVLSKTGNCV